jgi:hypothetical protein
MKEYYGYCKEAYWNFFKANPFLVFRNAVLNFLQSFSIGYINAGGWLLNLLSAGLGLIFLVVLFIYKKYIPALLIAFSGIGFTPYYPPIPVYMFGGYILIVFFSVEVLNLITRDLNFIKKLSLD